MTDREKVIKGLVCCMSEHICRGCPYKEKGECEDGGYYYSKAIEDALVLLKEQETQITYRDEIIKAHEGEIARLEARREVAKIGHETV